MININANMPKNDTSNISNTNRQNNTTANVATKNKYTNYSPSANNGTPDTVDISETGRKHSLQGQENYKAIKVVQSDEELMKTYQDQMDKMAKTKKSASKGASDFAKIMQIARRIADGDLVPAYDEQKLMEYNPVLYQAAKAAAVLSMKEERESHKSLYDDEEQSINDMQHMLETDQSSSSDTIVINEDDFTNL